MAKKILAVVGATGAQGGGLARAALADRSGEWAVRALTRDPGSEKARKLAAQGAEVVAANLDDAATLERAFAGAHGAYCVTNYWEHFSTERELAQARNMATAAKRAGVAHAIWSTLEDTRRWVPLDDPRLPTLHGKYKVPHFDAKGEADAFFTESGVPTTLFHTVFYWENFIHFGMGPKPGPDGKLALALPIGNARMPGIAVEDIGKAALGVFRKGRELAGKSIGIAGGHPTGAEMAAAFSRALGREVVFRPIEPEAYRKLGFPGADDLGNMFQFYRDFERDFCASRPVEATRALDPELLSFDGWLAAHVASLQVG